MLEEESEKFKQVENKLDLNEWKEAIDGSEEKRAVEH